MGVEPTFETHVAYIIHTSHSDLMLSITISCFQEESGMHFLFCSTSFTLIICLEARSKFQKFIINIKWSCSLTLYFYSRNSPYSFFTSACHISDEWQLLWLYKITYFLHALSNVKNAFFLPVKSLYWNDKSDTRRASIFTDDATLLLFTSSKKMTCPDQ
jgi:hypothetical protein